MPLQIQVLRPEAAVNVEREFLYPRLNLRRAYVLVPAPRAREVKQFPTPGTVLKAQDAAAVRPPISRAIPHIVGLVPEHIACEAAQVIRRGLKIGIDPVLAKI